MQMRRGTELTRSHWLCVCLADLRSNVAGREFGERYLGPKLAALARKVRRGSLRTNDDERRVVGESRVLLVRQGRLLEEN